MVKAGSFWWLLALFFGLPFLLLIDFFPFHRFGMFARISPVEKPTEKIYIEYFHQAAWKKLETGNAYMDANYLPQMASRALGNAKKEKELGRKLAKELPEITDSVRMRLELGNQITYRLLFPLP